MFLRFRALLLLILSFLIISNLNSLKKNFLLLDMIIYISTSLEYDQFSTPFFCARATTENNSKLKEIQSEFFKLSDTFSNNNLYLANLSHLYCLNGKNHEALSILNNINYSEDPWLFLQKEYLNISFYGSDISEIELYSDLFTFNELLVFFKKLNYEIVNVSILDIAKLLADKNPESEELWTFVYQQALEKEHVLEWKNAYYLYNYSIDILEGLENNNGISSFYMRRCRIIQNHPDIKNFIFAKIDCERAIEGNSFYTQTDHVLSYVYLSQIVREHGLYVDQSEIENLLMKGMNIQPDNFQLNLDLAFYYLWYEKKLDLAFYYANSAIEINRESPYGYIVLGDVFRIWGNNADAKSNYDKALSIDNNLTEIINKRMHELLDE